MNKCFAFVAVAFAVAVSGLAVDARASPVVVTAGSTAVHAGDSFSIPIAIGNAIDTTAWQFSLSFDPSLLRADGVREGSFLSAFGITLFGAGVIDNASGLISLVTDAYVDLPPLPSGNGELAEIDFTALGDGISPLALSGVFVDFVDSDVSTVDGSVCVGAAPAAGCTVSAIPEPPSLALLAVGLVVAGASRRKKRPPSGSRRQGRDRHGLSQDTSTQGVRS